MRRCTCLLLLALLGTVPAHAQTQTADAPADLEMLRANAERGHAASQYALGLRYANGVGGVDRDPVEALRWYRRSATQGHIAAQFAVAVMYERGVGATVDPVEAARWYLVAALQGHVAAQYNLALSYETGRGLVRNDVQARLWHERAALQGLLPAQLRVAEMYATGRGGEAEPTAAAAWYRAAATRGIAEAQVGLGLLLADEPDVALTDRDAYLWLDVAAQRGGERDRLLRARAVVAARLDAEGRAEARAGAEACRLAGYHFCGEPPAPMCGPDDAHRASADVLEAGAHPDTERPRLLGEVVAPGQEGGGGEIMLDVLVLPDGRVGPVCVRRSGGDVLDEAAVRAVRSWEFAPARRRDASVPVWLPVAVPVTRPQ